MTTMITEVYNAFRKAGVDEETAEKAAIALTEEKNKEKKDNQQKINDIDQRISNVEKLLFEIKAENKINRWMLGLIIAIQVIPFLKQLIN